MNTVLLLLHMLMLSDDKLRLPPLDDYLTLYCQYHVHPDCEPEEDESAAEAKPKEMAV